MSSPSSDPDGARGMRGVVLDLDSAGRDMDEDRLGRARSRPATPAHSPWTIGTGGISGSSNAPRPSWRPVNLSDPRPECGSAESRRWADPSCTSYVLAIHRSRPYSPDIDSSWSSVNTRQGEVRRNTPASTRPSPCPHDPLRVTIQVSNHPHSGMPERDTVQPSKTMVCNLRMGVSARHAWLVEVTLLPRVRGHACSWSRVLNRSTGQ